LISFLEIQFPDLKVAFGFHGVTLWSWHTHITWPLYWVYCL